MEPTDQNRRTWDEIHRSRTRAASEQLLIPEQNFDLIPAVEGKHVLHLQCVTGEATAELVELGALVTAVDISSEALDWHGSARQTSRTSTQMSTTSRWRCGGRVSTSSSRAETCSARSAISTSGSPGSRRP